MDVIRFEGASKQYTVGGRGASYLTLREVLRGVLRRGQAKTFWALQGVDLTVAAGEVVGIIGRNGAGKSTMLKLVTRITSPTAGRVRTRGRVGSLLEVGTGFHPELTGRENVFLGAAILGLRRAETARRFDDIVEFAGVQQFLDTPLKRYSSGMHLRLAFSVAAHSEPPLLAIDEVLAVGDAEFQRKCLGKISDFGRSDRTVLFVSHDTGAIASLCSRVVWLDGGEVKAIGEPREVVGQYLTAALGATTTLDVEMDDTSTPARLRRVSVVDAAGEPLDAVPRGESVRVRLEVEVREPVTGPDVAILLDDSQRRRLLDDALSDAGWQAQWQPGLHVLEAVIPPVLLEGGYTLGAWLGTPHEEYFHDDVLQFEVRPQPEDPQEWVDRQRLVQPEVRWAHRTA